MLTAMFYKAQTQKQIIMSNPSISNYIIISYKALPASIEAETKLSHLVEFYKAAYDKIVLDLRAVEAKYLTVRKELREQLKWEYSVYPVTNEKGIHYNITGKCLNPIEGDEDFCKDIIYCSFKIVNNVFISTGSGRILFNRGDVITDEEWDQLKANEVPMRLINTVATW